MTTWPGVRIRNFLFFSANETSGGRVSVLVRSSWTGSETAHVAAADDDLAMAISRRDCRALEALVARYERPLASYVFRLIGNTHDAQEVVQDTFLRAHRALTDQYSEERVASLALKPWLFRIARNLAFNKRRNLGPRLEDPLPDREESRFRPLETPTPPSSVIEKKREIEDLDRAISMLPSRSRELVVLRFIEEMSYAEIAATTGTSEASLRGQVFRSLRRLREILAEFGSPGAMTRAEGSA